MNPRTILFIHQAFPGQFKALARFLAAEGHRLYALAMNPTQAMPEVTLVKYAPVRRQLDEQAPAVLREMDARLIRAESVYQAMKALKQRGLKPDVIYAHPGWGEALFVKNVWPEARFAVYAEWYYNLHGQEVNCDPGMPQLTEEQELRLTLKNTSFLHALSACDAAIAPTEWQKSRYPLWAQEKISVIHEGLDIQELKAVRPRSLSIPNQGLKLRRGMPIVTYAARNLEPVRGFHYFMRALPAILNGNAEAHVIIMGRDAGVHTGYGAQNPQGTSWRKSMQAELGDAVDWKRVHFLGMLDRKLYLAMLKLSACHVYLTMPFICSWSFLEAAALGLPIVASDTAPVREFEHLKGLDFVGFTDVDGIARKVLAHLSHVDDTFFDANATALAALDVAQTLPAIRDVLLSHAPASDVGGALEDVVFDSPSCEEDNAAQDTTTNCNAERDKAFKEYIANTPVRKLQIGAGSNYLTGWFNTDIHVKDSIYYLDLKEKFPFPQNIFDYIYSEHNFEHFTIDEGYFILKECLRVLKSGGKIRIETPGLNKFIEYYHTDSALNNKYTKWEFDTFLKKKTSIDICTKGLVINNFFRDWGHKVIYDFETLQQLLDYAGFIDISGVAISKSLHPDLCNIEQHLMHMPDNFNSIETIVVEATKP